MDTRTQQQLDALTSEVDALRRRRDASPGRPYDTRLAQTCQVDGTDYPRFGDGPWLPIRFWQETRTRRVLDEPSQDAYCPIDWLPPETDVEVTLQPDGTYRLVRWPTELVGKVIAQYPSGAGISAAHWATSEEIDLDLGTGQLQVYRKSAAGIYSPQKYANDDPVLMTVWNPEGVVVSPTEVTTVIVDADAYWLIQPPEVRSGARWYHGSGPSSGWESTGDVIVPTYEFVAIAGPDADHWSYGDSNQVDYHGQTAWHRITLRAAGEYYADAPDNTYARLVGGELQLQQYRGASPQATWSAPLSWLIATGSVYGGRLPTAVETLVQLQHEDSLRVYLSGFGSTPSPAPGHTSLRDVQVIVERLVQ